MNDANTKNDKEIKTEQKSDLLIEELKNLNDQLDEDLNEIDKLEKEVGILEDQLPDLEEKLENIEARTGKELSQTASDFFEGKDE